MCRTQHRLWTHYILQLLEVWPGSLSLLGVWTCTLLLEVMLVCMGTSRMGVVDLGLLPAVIELAGSWQLVVHMQPVVGVADVQVQVGGLVVRV